MRRQNQYFTNTLLCLIACQWKIVVEYVDASAITTWSRSSVLLNGVSHSYPESFWRRMTSSLPRRKNVLDNISLTLDSEAVTLLVGESSAGKSTILRLILGTEIPTSGEVKISNAGNAASIGQPVILDSRPLYGQNEVVKAIWTKAISTSMSNSDATATGSELQNLSEAIGLRLESKILDLSTSEVYMCRLGEACIASTFGYCPVSLDSGTNPQETEIKANAQPSLPAPILLLDEWLDTETSTVIQKVQGSLEDLARNGAVIVCVTHKPQLFRNGMLRRVTLSRGKVLSISPLTPPGT